MQFFGARRTVRLEWGEAGRGLLEHCVKIGHRRCGVPNHIGARSARIHAELPRTHGYRRLGDYTMIGAAQSRRWLDNGIGVHLGKNASDSFFIGGRRAS